MHDPLTVAFEIRYPWAKSRRTSKSGREFVYREPFLTVWHVDPETDGTDNSCDWSGFRLSDEGLARLSESPNYRRLGERLGRDGEYLAGCLWREARLFYKPARPWWKHPRWHVWHWRLQLHPWQKLKRWLFKRCGHCGERFGWNESPITYSWSGSGPSFHEGCTEEWERGQAAERLITESQRTKVP